MPSMFPSCLNHLHLFFYSHYFSKGPSIQTKNIHRTWFWDPTCLLGSELWKASQSQPAADRFEKRVLSWGSDWESDQTRALDTFLLLALIPIHPAPSCLPTESWPRQGPYSYPIHSANPGRAFCLPRRKIHNKIQSWSRTRRDVISDCAHEKPTFTPVAATTNLHLNSFMILLAKI